MDPTFTLVARAHSTVSSVVSTKGQDRGHRLSHRWQQVGDQSAVCGSGQTAEQLSEDGVPIARESSLRLASHTNAASGGRVPIC